MTVFSLMRLTPQSFTASAIGIKSRFHMAKDDVLLLSEDNTWTRFRLGSSHSPRISCETIFCCPTLPPSARSQRDLRLPQLSFESLSALKNSETHTSQPERPTLERSQSDLSALLPPPSAALSECPGLSSIQSCPIHRRSLTAATMLSSTFSQSGSGSVFSKEGSESSVSSHSTRDSACWSDRGSFKRNSRPAVPRIPSKYRNQVSQSLRNGGRPMRPRSRPRMPPAKFWEYARQEQQKHNKSIQEPTSSATPMVRARSYTEAPQPPEKSPFRNSHSVDTRRGVSSGPRHRRSDTAELLARQGSYETLRKGESVPFMSHQWALKTDLSDIFGEVKPQEVHDTEEERGRRTSRESRTLVKKRQPWDSEPRIGVDSRRSQI